MSLPATLTEIDVAVQHLYCDQWTCLLTWRIFAVKIDRNRIPTVTFLVT
jgi:hypothetical protein